MKKILVLNYEFPPLGGGASPVSYELAEELSKTGDYDIDVVTMGFKGLLKYEEVNKNFRIHRVKCLRKKKEICQPWEQLTYLISGWAKCKELVKNNKFDICHTHFIIPTGILALRLKQKYDLPYIITSHGSDVLGYNARFKKLYPFLVGTWKSILNGAKLIISPSNFLKGEMLKVCPEFPEEKIKVIPNGFHADKFKPQVKKKYMLSTGRLLKNKGFQYLIQAVSDEDFGWEVHIAGDGPMMPALKALAKKSKTKVVFHGWLDNKGKEYKDLLEQSSIFVLVSEKENASIALLEAMSAGCAVITTNISGCPETVGSAGILVNQKDSVDLRLKLLSITNRQSELTDLQEFARNRIVDTFSWENVIKRYVESYE